MRGPLRRGMRLVAAALLSAGIALAEIGQGAALAQTLPASAEADLKAGRARLDFLAGDWRVEQFLPTRVDQWRSSGESALRFNSTLNDLYLETRAGSGGYVYDIVFSFDVARQLYRIISRDDRSGLIDVYEGVFDERGALIVSNVGPGTHYVSGGIRYHNRMIFTPTAGGWEWLVEVSGNGGQSWQPQVRVVARR